MADIDEMLNRPFRILVAEDGKIIKLSRSDVERLKELYFNLLCQDSIPPEYIRVHGHKVRVDELELALDIPF